MSAVVLLLSGFAGLICETVWARWFATVYGGTTPAAAAVLTAYLAGLALGSAGLGRRADRTPRPALYLATQQAGVALLAVLSLFVPRLLPPLYGRVLGLAGSGPLLGLARFALAGGFLLLPSFLMGGALPAAVRWASGRSGGSAGPRTGLLRSANLAGATAGAVVTALWLVPTFGLRGSVLFAAALNLLAALVAGLSAAMSSPLLPGATHRPLLVLQRKTARGTRGSEERKQRRRLYGVRRPPEQARRGFPSGPAAPKSTPQSGSGCGLRLFAGFRVFRGPFSLLSGGRRLRCDLCAPLRQTRERADGMATKEHTDHKACARRGAAAAVLVLIAVVGMLTMFVETAQLRALAFFAGGTLSSFAAATAAWLLALGAGSALGGWLARSATDESRAVRALAALLALAGAGAGSSVLILAGCRAPTDMAWRAMAAAACPGIPLGACFPLLVARLDPTGAQAGRAVGAAGAALEAGSVAGPILCALVLLPLAGTRLTLLIAGGVAVLAAAWLAVRLRPVSRRVYAWVGFGAVAALGAPLGAELYAPAILRIAGEEAAGPARLLSLDEGVEAVVSVAAVRRERGGPEVKVLCVGRKIQADDSEPWVKVEKTMGALPAVLCPRSGGRAFHVGLGSGVTAAWSAALAPGRVVEAAELVPGVAARLGDFRPHNEAGRFEVRLGDGRSLLFARAPLDLIVTDIVFPEDAGAGGLFGEEYFRLAQSRLAPQGVFLHWLPLWQMPPAAFRSVVRSFLEVFPEATLWSASDSAARPLAGLTAVNGDPRPAFDPAAMDLRLAAVRGNGARPEEADLGSAEAVMARFVAGPEALRRMSAGAVRSTDDYPVPELLGMHGRREQWARENLAILADLRILVPGGASSSGDR